MGKKAKNDFGIFIIEDNRDHYLKIKNSLLPFNCRSILDPEGSLELSNKEEFALEIFKESLPDSLKKTESFVISTIKQNQEWLRMIICDLQINGVNEGGTQLIRAIKNQLTGDPIVGWFARRIPILILSNMTQRIIIDAFSVAIGSSFSFTKVAAFESPGIIQDLITNMTSNFETVVNQHKFHKTYKVALSFTGSTIDENGKEINLRGFVEDVAHKLYEEYGKDKVYYDYHKKAVSASLTPKKLARIYADSEYVVVFLSKKYVDKESEWVKKEWEVIKPIVPEGKVIFVKLDNSITSEDFQAKLGIDENVYDNLVGPCSRFNSVINGKDEAYRMFMFKYSDIKPVTDLAIIGIKEYQGLLEHEISDAAKDIISIIKSRDEKRIPTP